MLVHTTDFEVLALLAGEVRDMGAPEFSAIGKFPISGPVTISLLGLMGDEQADLFNHGGPDKAIHHYAFDHYQFWRGELGEHPLLAAPGGFGENISTLGLTEDTVWLGDRFRLGTALVEVSHGRAPCWKLGHHFGRADLVKRVVRSNRAGWYYRVLEPGQAAAGDNLMLVERGLSDWTLARLFSVLIAKNPRRDPAELRELAMLPVLAEAWRRRARELLGDD